MTTIQFTGPAQRPNPVTGMLCDRHQVLSDAIRCLKCDLDDLHRRRVAAGLPTVPHYENEAAAARDNGGFVSRATLIRTAQGRVAAESVAGTRNRE
jgi:hypothetical protein